MRDLIGRTLGHYRIVEKIGEGGMGEVYRAHDGRVDREVAANVARSKEPLETARLWGTMKLESNGVRTVIIHALRKSTSWGMGGKERKSFMTIADIAALEGNRTEVTYYYVNHNRYVGEAIPRWASGKSGCPKYL